MRSQVVGMGLDDDDDDDEDEDEVKMRSVNLLHGLISTTGFKLR